jgi:hypothetical protein
VDPSHVQPVFVPLQAQAAPQVVYQQQPQIVYAAAAPGADGSIG